MTATTCLEPLAPERARQLLALMRRASADPTQGLALDGQGRVTGVVPVDDPRTEHLLGDLDVHA